uniref:Uncharacterized protein n=1 Tax=Mycobacterium kansasii TaxID=1768 RepID=A0A653F8Z2_MYCKA|nr:hypothetical protein BIN_B_05315 [Mycobacterium kansasii]
MWDRTKSSTTACCSASGRPCRRCASADFDLAAASASSTWRLVGALTRSLNIGGTATAWARSALRSMRAGARNGWSTISAVSNNSVASSEDNASTPSRPSRARSAASSPPVMSLACSHRPHPSDIAGNPWARRCAASPSRKVLAAA